MCVTDAGAYVIGVDASVKRADRRGVSEFPVPPRRAGWIDRCQSLICRNVCPPSTERHRSTPRTMTCCALTGSTQIALTELLPCRWPGVLVSVQVCPASLDFHTSPPLRTTDAYANPLTVRAKASSTRPVPRLLTAGAICTLVQVNPASSL